MSSEHVIPESLGNIEHMLPKGWVCDACNNYFAREVEKPLMDSLYWRSARFAMAIPNKRRRIPSVTGFHPQSRTKIELFRSLFDRSLSIAAADESHESRWISLLQSHSHGTLYVPTAIEPDVDITTARFIGKVALEALALRCIDVPGANDEIVDKPELDELRRYVRRGQPRCVWPVRVRHLYPPDHRFADGTNGRYEVLHEWTLLRVPQSEYYAVIAIFGIEYAINLGGPELAGYDRWLKASGNRSPLYDRSWIGLGGPPH